MYKKNILNLPANSNQTRGLIETAKDMLSGKYGSPPEEVLIRCQELWIDELASSLGGLTTHEIKALRDIQLGFQVHDSQLDKVSTGYMLGSNVPIHASNAVYANVAVRRILDTNPTIFGNDQNTGANAGEFAHLEWMEVILSACQQKDYNGRDTLEAMAYYTQLHGTLCAHINLRQHAHDHVMDGGMACLIIYMLIIDGEKSVDNIKFSKNIVDNIENAMGLLTGHNVAMRSSRQASTDAEMGNSKGLAAGILAQRVIQHAKEATSGGITSTGDVFRNTKGMFCAYPNVEKDHSPFEINILVTGDAKDWCVNQNHHHKLWGIHEHQAASLMDLMYDFIQENKEKLKNIDEEEIFESIEIHIYLDAWKIIGLPEKWNPGTTEEADHSAMFILSQFAKKALRALKEKGELTRADVIMMPSDYRGDALNKDKNPFTWNLMPKITLKEPSKELSARYPKGIPSELSIKLKDGTQWKGEMDYPVGHALNDRKDFKQMLKDKFFTYANLVTPSKDIQGLWDHMNNIANWDSSSILNFNKDIPIK